MTQTAAGPTRDRLAEVVMAVLEKPELAGYRLPKRPADLAYFVVDALYPEAVAAFARDLAEKVRSSDFDRNGTASWVNGYDHARTEVLRLLDAGVPQEERTDG